MFIIMQRHPEGVASIGFKETESADMCVRAMNGRWYGGRQLEVVVWDGVTNYQVWCVVVYSVLIQMCGICGV